MQVCTYCLKIKDYRAAKCIVFLVSCLLFSLTACHSAMAVAYVQDIDESYFYSHPMADSVDVNTLQSRPGAANCIFLWSGGLNRNGYIAWTPPPLEILITFNSVAEDYYPFDVNITTSQTVYNTYPSANRSAGVYSYFRGGQSLIGQFGNGSDVAETDFSTGVQTAAHEFGHMIGLYHDGGYYRGRWPLSPIMGSSSPTGGPVLSGGGIIDAPISHWYNGYHGGDSSVNDITFIGNVLGVVPDDHSESQSLLLEEDGSIIPENNPGGIQSNSDTDEWDFSLTETSTVNFLVKPNAIRSPNLFVGLTIVKSDGVVVATGEPHGLYGLESLIDTLSLPAGDYSLVIDGIAPPTTWFSDYSSFGPYRIYGSVSGGSSGKGFINTTILMLLLLEE